MVTVNAEGNHNTEPFHVNDAFYLYNQLQSQWFFKFIIIQMQGGNIKKEYFRDYSLEIQKINYEEIKNTKKFSPINCFFYNVLDFNSTVVSITDCERTRIRK